MNPTFSDEAQAAAQHQAALCKVFSNAQRVLILWFLAEGEKTVSEIADAIGASLSSTSQHLHFMELSAVLESRREKQNIYYRVTHNPLIRDFLVLVNLPQGGLTDTPKS